MSVEARMKFNVLLNILSDFSLEHGVEDKFTWKFRNNGIYTVLSGYFLLTGQEAVASMDQSRLWVLDRLWLTRLPSKTL